jgi:hypothetical protein
MNEGSHCPNSSPTSNHSTCDLWPDDQLDLTTEAVRKLILEEDELPTPRDEPTRVVSGDSAGRPRSDTGRTGPMGVPRIAIVLIRLAARLLRRPDAPRLIAIMLLVIAFLMEPWFLLTLLVLGMLTTQVAYFSLGPDRVSELVVAWYDRLRQRDPERAETIRRRAARSSKQISAIIERLPDKWTTGLYLPDFEEPPELPEKMKSDPFDRLATQVSAARGP